MKRTGKHGWMVIDEVSELPEDIDYAELFNNPSYSKLRSGCSMHSSPTFVNEYMGEPYREPRTYFTKEEVDAYLNAPCAPEDAWDKYKDRRDAEKTRMTYPEIFAYVNAEGQTKMLVDFDDGKGFTDCSSKEP
jgi:hypothetical protein